MENVIAKKSYAFAIRIIKLYKFLIEDKKEFILSKQLLRSGTAIGALVKESEHAQSKADFLNKMNVALKEANETEYWLIPFIKHRIHKYKRILFYKYRLFRNFEVTYQHCKKYKSIA